MKPFYIFILSAFTVFTAYLVDGQFKKMQKRQDDYILMMKCKSNLTYDARCAKILEAKSKKDTIN